MRSFTVKIQDGENVMSKEYSSGFRWLGYNHISSYLKNWVYVDKIRITRLENGGALIEYVFDKNDSGIISASDEWRSFEVAYRYHKNRSYRFNCTPVIVKKY